MFKINFDNALLSIQYLVIANKEIITIHHEEVANFEFQFHVGGRLWKTSYK